MRRQYTFIAPKGKASKVRMGRHLFNIHCDTQPFSGTGAYYVKKSKCTNTPA